MQVTSRGCMQPANTGERGSGSLDRLRSLVAAMTAAVQVQALDAHQIIIGHGLTPAIRLSVPHLTSPLSICLIDHKDVCLRGFAR